RTTSDGSGTSRTVIPAAPLAAPCPQCDRRSGGRAAPDLVASAGLGRADLVGGLIVERRSSLGGAVGEAELRPVPRTLDAAADEAPLAERAAGVGTRVVERMDRRSDADENQRRRSRPGLRRDPLRDVR